MNRYQKAYNKVVSELPNWKQKSFQEDILEKKKSRIVDEVTQKVIELAENEEIALTE